MVFGLTLVGLGLVFGGFSGTDTHGKLGYLVLLLAFAQIALGIFRGTKGGPTALCADGTPRGDHYDMTRRRVLFEWVHKVGGYMVLGLAAVTILMGLWDANAPVWMWLGLALWWTSLILAFILLQKRGRALDTYQAIWGPGDEHPGNKRKPIGWGIQRAEDVRQPGE